jgi:hypothetical protein
MSASLMLPDDDSSPLCPTCGCDLEWEECDELGCEDGELDAFDLDAIVYEPGDTKDCPRCGGRGGAYWCPLCQKIQPMVRR